MRKYSADSTARGKFAEKVLRSLFDGKVVLTSFDQFVELFRNHLGNSVAMHNFLQSTNSDGAVFAGEVAARLVALQDNLMAVRTSDELIEALIRGGIPLEVARVLTIHYSSFFPNIIR